MYVCLSICLFCKMRLITIEKKKQGEENQCSALRSDASLFSSLSSSSYAKFINVDAYCIGLTFGCGTASNCTKLGFMSDPNRIQAPLLPIWSQ